MRRYTGTQDVHSGVYLNLSNWEFVWLFGGKTVLPGDAGQVYVKTNMLLSMVAAPFAGFVLIMFLPFITIVGTLGLFVRKLTGIGS